MKIGGYSHSNGITFFSDNFKVKGYKKHGNDNYKIDWINPPSWMRKLDGKFIVGGILSFYYQWKVLDNKIKYLFFLFFGIYILDSIANLSSLDVYMDYIFDDYFGYILGLGGFFLLINYPRIIRTFRYHGAEHKAINAYMAHGYVDYHTIKKASRFNIRCGTNISTIFILLYIPFWFLNIDSMLLIGLLFLVSLQIIKILADKRYQWDKYVQLLQWITALEPRDEELIIAIESFNRLRQANNILKREIIAKSGLRP